MTHDNYEIDVSAETFCVDWGENDHDGLTGKYSAAVYRKASGHGALAIYVHGDTLEDLHKAAYEAVITLASTVDWFSEWDRLSRAVLEESDRCTGAALFAKRRGEHWVADAYRQQAERLRRIHAGQSPDELGRDLRLSVPVTERMRG